MVKYVEGLFSQDYIQSLGIENLTMIFFALENLSHTCGEWHAPDRLPRVYRCQLYGEDGGHPKRRNHIQYMGPRRPARVCKYASPGIGPFPFILPHPMYLPPSPPLPAWQWHRAVLPASTKPPPPLLPAPTAVALKHSDYSQWVLICEDGMLSPNACLPSLLMIQVVIPCRQVCNDAAAILFMFDLTRIQTLANVKEWYRQVGQQV